MKSGAVSFDTTRKELLRNDKVKQAYDALEPEFSVIEQIVKARIEKGITQESLARKMKTKQSVISRLERGNGNPSLKFLKRLAQALDSRLVVQFQ